MSIRVYYPEPPEGYFIDHLKASLSDAISIRFGSENVAEFRYEILVAGVPAADQLAVSPDLHSLIIPWAGLPKATRELLENHPVIRVHNLHHNCAPTAELAIALMLAASKQLLPLDRMLRRGDWRARYKPSTANTLQGRTALVVGFGAIGRHVSKICHALGMNVRAVSRSGTSDFDDGVELHPVIRLHELLRGADVVHLCLPLTFETKGLIGEKELELLPDGSIIINMSRGDLIDESALFDELKSGRLSAGLDVWYTYPQSEAERNNTTPSEFPFEKLDNVVMTPHIGGHSIETEKLRAEALASLLNAAAEGKAMPNRVDLARGY